MLGSIYTLYVNDTFAAADVFTEHYGGWRHQQLGYAVCAMLIGYIAEALNRDSFSFRRTLIAALLGGSIGGLLMLWTPTISPIEMVTAVTYVLFITMLSRIIHGFIVPIFITLFGWFGITPKQMT